jgi:hypothetical protein
MKYRLLDSDELSHFNEELVQFLIVNGIHGEEWEKLNKTDPEKAIELVGIFSDQVLQKVYENIKYLEFRAKDRLLLFYLGIEKIGLIGLESGSNSEVDFSDTEKIHRSLQLESNGIRYFRSAKEYSGERELEIHQMIGSGCIPSTAQFWEYMNELTQNV